MTTKVKWRHTASRADGDVRLEVRAASLQSAPDKSRSFEWTAYRWNNGGYRRGFASSHAAAMRAAEAAARKLLKGGGR